MIRTRIIDDHAEGVSEALYIGMQINIETEIPPI